MDRNQLLPHTHVKCIEDENGNNLNTLLEAISASVVGVQDKQSSMSSLTDGMITQAEWAAMQSNGTLTSTLYFIKNSSGELARIYYKDTVIARKASSGETVSAGFPLVFPFIFS